MKKLFIAAGIFCLASLSGCHNAADQELIAQQARANDSIMALLNEKSKALTEITDAVSSFQQRLTDIKERQGLIAMNSSNSEVSTRQLQDDIDIIAEEMEKNRKTIQSLRYSLNKNRNQGAEYQKIISALQAQVDQQAEEIAALKAELEKRNVKITKLEEIVSSTSEELESTKTSLTETTAAKEAAEATVKKQKSGYYVADTQENLIANGVLDGAGNIIAKGTETCFQQIDKTTQFSIELPSNGKKFKILTKQASNRRFRKSFTLDQASKSIKISDSGIFWGADKYLVVEITKTE